MPNLAMKILQWQAKGHVGVSSATMASIAAGLDTNFYGGSFGSPRDPADMLRSMSLIDDIPEIRNYFPIIAERVKEFRGIIEHWDELILVMNRECVGDNWRAPDAYKMIQQLREAADAVF